MGILQEIELPCKRRVFAALNIVMALLIAAVGLAIIVILYDFNQDKFLQSYQDLRDFSDVVFQWSFTIACCLLQLAMCGGAASYIRSRFLAWMYAALLLPTVLAFFYMAQYSTAIYTASSEGL